MGTAPRDGEGEETSAGHVVRYEPIDKRRQALHDRVAKRGLEVVRPVVRQAVHGRGAALSGGPVSTP
jgi:hypothetical protein